jgi:hypothetical protein
VQPPVSAQAVPPNWRWWSPTRRPCSRCTMRGAHSACRSCRRR